MRESGQESNNLILKQNSLPQLPEAPLTPNPLPPLWICDPLDQEP